VLSGEPDQIQEPLYSNLFEIATIPQIIWTASPRPIDSESEKISESIPDRVIYLWWNGKIVTFEEISEPSNPLWNMVEPRSVESDELVGSARATELRALCIQETVLRHSLDFTVNFFSVS
jgi:hypothetical protein